MRIPCQFRHAYSWGGELPAPGIQEDIQQCDWGTCLYRCYPLVPVGERSKSTRSPIRLFCQFGQGPKELVALADEESCFGQKINRGRGAG
jgi:hypothetical protein